MKTIKCANCGKEFPENQMTEYAGEMYCEECSDELLTTCDRCGEAISYDDANHSRYGMLCDCCHDDLFG